MAVDLEVCLQTAIALPDEITAIAPAQWHQWFTTWFEQTTPVFKLPAALSYTLTLRFCNDEEIQQLNHQYRDQDKPTDVLAFAMLDALDLNAIAPSVVGDSEFELGDIIISLPTAKRQTAKHTLRQEVIWLASHGFLHLLGWDHPDVLQLEQMLNQQQHLLEKIAIVPPYFEYGRL